MRKYGDPLAGAFNAHEHGEGTVTPDGYRIVSLGDGAKKLEHVAIAERAFGRPLPAGAIVHHVDVDRLNNEPSNLVICPSQKYHLLLHTRTAALYACGNPSWRKCRHCLKYDAVENLSIISRVVYHKACAAAYQRGRAAQQKEQYA